jgi:hypothetical protein
VFFENGNPMKPVYFASAPGIPNQTVDTSIGFNDPSGVYPNIIKDDITTETEPTEAEPPSTKEDGSELIITINRFETNNQGTKGDVTTNIGFNCKSLELP